MDVLQHHNGVVYDQADGQNQGQEGEDVDREAERPEDEKGRGQGHGHGDRRHQHGAHAAEKQVDHQDDKTDGYAATPSDLTPPAKTGAVRPRTSQFGRRDERSVIDPWPDVVLPRLRDSRGNRRNGQAAVVLRASGSIPIIRKRVAVEAVPQRGRECGTIEVRRVCHVPSNAGRTANELHGYGLVLRRVPSNRPRTKWILWLRRALLLVPLFLLGPLGVLAFGNLDLSTHWSEAR